MIENIWGTLSRFIECIKVRIDYNFEKKISFEQKQKFTF